MAKIEVNESPRKPNLRITFDLGTYEDALMNYQAAKSWTLDNGLCFRGDLEGTISSPRHPSSPDSIRIVPDELINEPQWTVVMEFYCSSAMVFKKIAKELRLPYGSTLEILRATEQETL